MKLELRWFCFFAFLLFVSVVTGQWEFGGFVGTDSSTQSLAVWNANANSSYIEVCTQDFGGEHYSPAYTVDVSSRSLIYLHANPLDNVVTQTPFSLDTSTNTFTCGPPVEVCREEWHTNQTSRIYHDPALNVTIMIDTVYVEIEEFYEVRVWKFSVPACELEFVDVFKMGPILESSELSSMYDYSNHRLYCVYDAIERYAQHRLRGVDIRYPSVLYDFVLPFEREAEVYAQFDASSGQIVAIGGIRDVVKNTTLQGYLISPLHLTTFEPKQWIVGDFQIGGGTENIQINWRQSVLVSQRFNGTSNGYDQYAWRVLSGEYQTEIFLPHAIDNGWFYDPLLQIAPVDINTATQSALESVPGLTSTGAENIVQFRDRNGPFATVDEMFSLVSNVTLQSYYTSRPYICV